MITHRTEGERHDYTPHWRWTFWEGGKIKREIRNYYGCEYEGPSETSMKFCHTTPHHILDGQQPFNRIKICHTTKDMQVRTYEGWNFNSGNYLFTTHTK